MRIKKLSLKKYKRFFDLTIDLGENPRRIVALVGPNGCGKSSVFDAMLFLKNSWGHIGVGGQDKDYTYHSLEHSPGYNYQNIILDFDSGDFLTVHDQRKKSEKKTRFSPLGVRFGTMAL